MILWFIKIFKLTTNLLKIQIKILMADNNMNDDEQLDINFYIPPSDDDTQKEDETLENKTVSDYN